MKRFEFLDWLNSTEPTGCLHEFLSQWIGKQKNESSILKKDEYVIFSVFTFRSFKNHDLQASGTNGLAIKKLASFIPDQSRVIIQKDDKSQIRGIKYRE